MIQLKHRSGANPSENNGNEKIKRKKEKQIAICLGANKRRGNNWEIRKLYEENEPERGIQI